MKRFNVSRLFISLVLVSCIIGITPLMLLGYFSYNKSATIVLEEVTEGNRLILLQNKEKVESLLRTIDTLTTQTVSSPVTTNAVSMSTVLNLPYQYEHIQLFESMIYKLVQIQVYELGTEDVQMISFRRNWVIDAGTVHDMEGRDHSTMINRNLHRLHTQLMEYRGQGHGSRSLWILEQAEKSGYVLKLVMRIPLNSVDPYGLISVNVPLLEISKRLTGGDQLGEVVIVDNNGTVLSHSNSILVGTNAADTPYYNELHNHKSSEGYFTYENNKENYTVIYNRSTYNDWTYLALTPTNRLMERSQIIKGYTIISICIIIVLIIIASIAASFRTYSPIRRIYRFMKDDKLQHFKDDELRYIGNQVKHMVKSQSEMVDEIESLNRQARILFVIKLLQGDIEGRDLEYLFEKYGFSTHWTQWDLIAVQIDTLEGTQYSAKDWDLLMHAIQNIVEEIVQEEVRLSPVIQNQCLLIFIGNLKDDSKPLKVQVFNHAELIQQTVRHYLKLKVSIGISRIYGKFIHAPQAKQECMDALKYRLRIGGESILFIDEVQLNNQDMFRYPKDLEFRIMEAVRQLDAELAREGLEQIIERFFERHMNHNDYQIFLGRLFNNLTGMVQDDGISVQLVFREDIFASDVMHGMHSPQKIRDWFDTEILVPLLRWMEEKQQKQDVNISQAIIEAIHQDYDKYLNIELFASRLNYHISYISRVFKKDTGVTLTDYINQYRIEVSKRWLKETDMKISDIAERLRYSTASNFNRNFKKIVNITPSQYREKYK